ncbi:MAG: hypothetical protein PWR20_1745 [Bacteroidales bacterium]|jgi:phosphoglycerol transferase MdoB-like AlkP superfamily enzyme|nr:hypothetical protein [Bacteroidales bacterium]MDN5329845.1 hypothetical protein [Bacteroidales bacterium]
MRISLQYKVGTAGLLLYRILLALLFMSLSRLMLYFFQKSLFNFPDFPGIAKLFLAGLRFDISAVLILNLPYLVWSLFPLPVRNNSTWKKAGNVLYYSFNILAIFLNMVDSAYFPFNLKRLTADIFTFVEANNNIFILIPRFFYDFYTNLLIFILLVTTFVWFVQRLKQGKPHFYGSLPSFIIWNLFFLLITLSVSIIGIRGGLQRRPISVINACDQVQPQYASIVLNTPFTIIKTWNKKGLPERNYFKTEQEAAAIYNPVKNYYHPDAPQRKDNIVIIILESFSAEHSAFLNPELYPPHSKGFTPFLDSLMKQGLTFRAYANGKRSIEGIPAIVAGIPHLFPVEFINSPYSSNEILALPQLLKKRGYSTVFYHGGINGTMHFDAFARKAGFDEYKGMKEYSGPPAFDGQWGIFDEPYLRYVANDIDHLKEPFFITVFTLSSHHPYNVPDSLKTRLPSGPLKIQQSIAYADLALRRFFDAIKNKPWYPHTLFILTADHTSAGYHPFYKTLAGQYSIPLVFFKPADTLPQLHKATAQQMDILPSICDYLNLKDTIVCFGNSVFDTLSPAYSISYLNSTYNFFKSDRVLLFDGEKTIGWYDLKKDSLQLNIHKTRDIIVESDELLLKSIIQQFNHRMQSNHLTP